MDAYLDYLAQTAVCVAIGAFLLRRERRRENVSSDLWAWAWLALGASSLLAGPLLFLIDTGRADSSLRSGLSLLSTISVLYAASLLFMGLQALRTGRRFETSYRLRLLGVLAAVAFAATLVTVPSPPDIRLFWRVGVFRSLAVGLSFVLLGWSAFRAVEVQASLRHRLLFGISALVWGVYLISYWGASGWNAFRAPVDLSYRATMQPLETACISLLALGMMAWILGEEEEARHRMERTLREARRREALGILASGVAHEFNNLSQIIMLSAESIEAPATPESDEAHRSHAVETILEACRRIRAITGALLDYTRTSPTSPESAGATADIAEAVRVNTAMLRRVFPTTIALTEEGVEAPIFVPVADVDLRQVIFNLCINARDAMPDGGDLRLSLSLDSAGDLPVVLKVSDSGVGLSEHAREMAFQPFFTTKPPRGGTGLGLSSALGIVTAAGGTVDLNTEEGHGTTFTVRLPTA